MRVKELTIHNFRGIKDLHLEFNTEHNVVVLVGVNGVGKSSVLDCINIFIRYFQVIRENSDVDKSYRIHQNLLSHSDVQIGTDSIINKIKLNLYSDCDVDYEMARFDNSSDREEVSQNRESWLKIHQETTNNIHLKSIQTDKKCSCFHYFSDRKVLDLTEFRSLKAENDFSVIEIRTQEPENIIDFTNFLKWFRDAENLENELRLSGDNKYRLPILNSVRHAIDLILDQRYEQLTVKRSINRLKITPPAIDRMTINKSGKQIAVELLSDGEKSLLAMISDLSRRLAESYSDLENPLEAPALVLIDEIELHLHPAWQRMIIPQLIKTFPNCQFIVTTHSPQVLSHVDAECIHILDYEGDNVIVKRPENSFGLDSNRILEDILGVPKRPQEIQDEMLELFRKINNNDLDAAKQIVQKLGSEIGINEPELVKAEATIKRREIIGR